MKRAFLVAGLMVLSGLAFAGKRTRDLHLTQSWQVSLDADGRVTRLDPIDELAPAVRDPLERAIRGWTFEPGRIEGRPAPTETTLTLDVSFAPGQGDDYSVRIDDARTGGRIVPDISRKGAPRFPREAVKRGLFAMIVVRVDYDVDGRVVAVEPQPQYAINSMRVLEKATAVAVKKWMVAPERVGGRAVASSLLLPVCYTVTSGRPPEYDCAFTPEGSTARIGEGGAFALESSTQLRSEVIGRTL